jgi:hypothetical protein
LCHHLKTSVAVAQGGPDGRMRQSKGLAMVVEIFQLPTFLEILPCHVDKDLRLNTAFLNFPPRSQLTIDLMQNSGFKSSQLCHKQTNANLPNLGHVRSLSRVIWKNGPSNTLKRLLCDLSFIIDIFEIYAISLTFTILYHFTHETT